MRNLTDAQDYKQSIIVNADHHTVFKALTKDVHQWWSSIDGSAIELGDIFKIKFGGESYWKFKIVELSPGKKVTWECIESNQDHNIKGMDEEWLGTRLRWKIKESPKGVEVNFIHEGLVSDAACYGTCSKAWDFYITESLKSYLDQGKGSPGEV